MKIELLYFGLIAETIGDSKGEMEIDEKTQASELIGLLKTKYPDLEKYTFEISINQELAKGYDFIPDKAEIAVLPPFAGG